jgi:glycosyltransferase involved in cell wall biosynthesis
VVNWQDRENPLAGGAEIHLHQVFGRLADRGHDVTLLVSGFAGAAARTRLDGMDVHRTGGRHTFSLAAPRYYRRSLRGLGFDVVVEDLNKVPLFATFWVEAPLVLLVHHLFGATAFAEASLPIATATWLLERPVPRVYARVPVQAVSRSTADDLVARGLDRSQIVIIPNGIDLTVYQPDPGVPRFEQPTLLYLGRLKRYKRIDLILRAVRRLADEGIGAELLIAGTGDQEDALRRLASRLGLQSCVRLLGHVSEEEKLRLLRRAWVHVNTSTKEGWGISNLEAAASGTPTVASDSPGLRDSVIDQETGLLVGHGDVVGLAHQLRRLIEQPALRERLGQGARRFALTFTWDRSADLTEAHLRQFARPGDPISNTAARTAGNAQSHTA